MDEKRTCRINLVLHFFTTVYSCQREIALFALKNYKTVLQACLPRAKSMLEKALASDPAHLPAVYLLAEILEQESIQPWCQCPKGLVKNSFYSLDLLQEMSTDKAIELLRRQLKTHSTARLHQMLADLLAKTHDEEQALEHYTIGKK